MWPGAAGGTANTCVSGPGCGAAAAARPRTPVKGTVRGDVNHEIDGEVECVDD